MTEVDAGTLALSEDIQSRFIPVSPETHGQLCWQRFASYGFAQRYQTAPVVLGEIHQAANVAPILFSRSDSTPTQAVMLLRLNQHYALVSPSGQWRGTYVPGSLRIHPFGIARTSQNDEGVMRLDPQSPCLQTLGRGDRLYEPTGGASPAFQSLLDFAQTYHGFQLRTQHACHMLDKAGVLTPAASISALDHPQCNGLFVIDRKAFGKISPKWQSALFETGALELAYAHMTSLGRLTALRHSTGDTAPEPQEAPAAAAGQDDFLHAMAQAYDAGSTADDGYLSPGQNG